VARHGYAADAPFIDSPRDARYHYAKRFGIEASYRLSEQSIATTSTQNPVVRLLYVVVSLLLQNVWRYLHWEYVATPPPRRASPLAVVVQGVHQHDPTGSVDGPSRCVGPSPQTGHRTTGLAGNHQPDSLQREARRCRVGGSRRRQRQLSVGSSKILSLRPSVQPLRHRTQASETASRGCFVMY